MLTKEKHIVSNSESSRQILIENGVSGQNITVIYRSLPPRAWYEQDVFPVDLSKGRPIHFLCPGRISKEKGVISVLEAILQLNNDDYTQRYDVSFVGDGNMKSWLFSKKEELNISNLIIREPVPIGDMINEYLDSDVVLIPVLHEDSFPRVTLESLMCGRPIISTLKGGIKEAASSIDGAYMKIEDGSSLRNAMKILIENPEIIKDMSRKIIAQKERIVAKFNHEKMIQQYIDYYEGVLF